MIAANSLPALVLAVVMAVVAGVLLAFGTHIQSSAVAETRRAPHVRKLIAGSIADRQWVMGGAVLLVAIVMQLWSVSLAPVSVIQPLGISALITSALIRWHSELRALNAALVRNVMFCVGGVTIFVVLSTRFSNESVVGEESAWELVIAVLVVAGVVSLIALGVRGKARRAVLITQAGVLFGSVVTLAKVLLSQPLPWNSGRGSEALSLAAGVACGLVLVLAALAGTGLVQVAHRTSAAEFVVASLTVVDPLTAVLLGGTFLGEMAALPVWAAMAMAGAGVLAICGVVGLSRGRISDPARGSDRRG